ncbi:MAG: hypothetical protein CMI02_00705 [Oceanospirillaceae bacterium]|nr:hypothetical protein [Oceanospirillaceae bacterium]MBT10538.1 hypothetical protein [Oceanospirillaceae bacterium]|tara:strand:+ start:51988 stop:53523 length:1536 start_codon:yes stop_codon:yes gene_type:complete
MTSRRNFLKTMPAALLALAPASQWVQALEQRKDDDTLTIAYPKDIAGWDPLNMDPLQSVIIQCVFEQPLALAADLSLAPSPVQHCEWLDNHCQTLQLIFRDNVFFHDGSELTAEDFRFSFIDRAKEHPATLLAGVWSLIDHIDTPSTSEAVIYFKYPMATAKAMLADIPAFILPSDYYQKQGGSDAFARRPVGSGPYRLTEYQRGSRIVLEAFDHYWQGKAPVKRLIFLISSDSVARAAMVQARQADIAVDLSVRESLKLGSETGLQSLIHPSTAMVMLQMVNKGVFTDKNVRLALHHAINKDAIAKGLFVGHATPVSVPAGPGMPGYIKDFEFPFDPDHSRELLAESGYDETNPLTIRFYATKGVLPNDLEMAQAIQYMWRQVGIQTELQVLTQPMIASYQQQGKIDGPLLQGWNPAAGDPGTYSGYLLHPALSFALWKSDDVGEKLYPLMAETNDKVRIEKFREFDRWQVKQGYSIPLFQRHSTCVAWTELEIQSRLTGLINPYRIRIS